LEHSLANYKADIAESQNRIGVQESLLRIQLSSGLLREERIVPSHRSKVVAEYLMDVIREANEQIKADNDESAEHREKLAKHRKLFAAANKTLASIIENGPDMQNVMFEEEGDNEPLNNGFLKRNLAIHTIMYEHETANIH
jgi:hypothetical protein